MQRLVLKEKQAIEQEEMIYTTFFDQIVSEDSKQGAIAVTSIMEAVFAVLKQEFSALQQLGVLSDNEKCYHNALVPVVLLLMSEKYGFSLRDFVHSETQYVKGVGHSHFAVGMRYVNRYIKETCNDVSKPAQLITALSYDGGLAGSTVKLIKSYRSGSNFRPFLTAVAEKQLAPLGLVK